MLYCAKCNKDVDFNSVAVQNTSSPRAAMTMMGEDISPTIISGGSTSTEIVNVCKECGQNDRLWPSKSDFKSYIAAQAREEEQRLEKSKDQDKLFMAYLKWGTIIGAVAVCAALCAAFIYNFDASSDFSVTALTGLLITLVIAGLIGALIGSFVGHICYHLHLFIKE